MYHNSFDVGAYTVLCYQLTEKRGDFSQVYELSVNIVVIIVKIFRLIERGFYKCRIMLFQLLAIVIYMIAMLAIGWYAFVRTKNLNDYMLGGRGLGPAVTALSAGAADMSGWLLMGLPGAIYLNGLVDAWIAIGLTIGAYLNWLFVAPRLRVYTQVASDSITIPSFLDNRLRDNTKAIRIAAGIIILVFFTFYVSVGMVAGGKFFD